MQSSDDYYEAEDSSYWIVKDVAINIVKENEQWTPTLYFEALDYYACSLSGIKNFQNIKLFCIRLICLSSVREVRQMKKSNVIQWFIQLFRKDMKEYQADEKVKMEIYQSVKKK